MPQPILDYCEIHDLELASFASLEAQVAAIADDIAYNTHDIDDGLRSGYLTFDMLEEIPFLAGLMAEVRDALSAIWKRAASRMRSCAGRSRAWSRT